MLLEEQPGNRKSKNKDKKKVKEAQEAELKKRQRKEFPLRTLPVSLEATMGSNDEEKAGRWCIMIDICYSNGVIVTSPQATPRVGNGKWASCGNKGSVKVQKVPV
jgi:hypothetical protein